MIPTWRAGSTTAIRLSSICATRSPRDASIADRSMQSPRACAGKSGPRSAVLSTARFRPPRMPPVSELGLAGAAIGAAMAGQRPLVDMSTGSFIFQAFAQVVNEAANIHYMSGGQTAAPVTFYSLAGMRTAGAAQHSHRTQAMLGQAPGLQIMAPGAADDAYHLLKWALLHSLNPTGFLSHPLLFNDTMEVDMDAAPPLGAGGGRAA